MQPGVEVIADIFEVFMDDIIESTHLPLRL
jgi:hypothetical protein